MLQSQIRVTQLLTSHLSSAQDAVVLQQAMQYAVLEGGKRIRPLLVYATGEMLGVPIEKLDDAACAVELIHAYSLVHDDLPVLDNDDFRRGIPSCHKKFGEAIALLAGDALQALAFKVLTQVPVEAEKVLLMIQVLADSVGFQGVIAGESLEFSTDKCLTVDELEALYRLKTSSLLDACMKLGAILGGASSLETQNFSFFSEKVGIAFQIQDDLQDRDETSFNYVSCVGASVAQKRLETLYQEAKQVMHTYFSDKAQPIYDWLSFLFPDLH